MVVKHKNRRGFIACSLLFLLSSYSAQAILSTEELRRGRAALTPPKDTPSPKLHITGEELQQARLALSSCENVSSHKRTRTDSALLREIQKKNFKLTALSPTRKDAESSAKTPASLERKKMRAEHLKDLLNPIRRDAYIAEHFTQLHNDNRPYSEKTIPYSFSADELAHVALEHQDIKSPKQLASLAFALSLKRIEKLIQSKGDKGTTMTYLNAMAANVSKEFTGGQVKRIAAGLKDYQLGLNLASIVEFSLYSDANNDELALDMASIAELAIVPKQSDFYCTCDESIIPGWTYNTTIKNITIWGPHTGFIVVDNEGKTHRGYFGYHKEIGVLSISTDEVHHY